MSSRLEKVTRAHFASWWTVDFRASPDSIEQWASENLTIPSGDSDDHGGKPFNPFFQPCLRIVYRFLEDKQARFLVMPGVAQLGKTMAIWAGAGWVLCNKKTTVVETFPDEKKVRDMSKSRLRPFYASIPGIGAEIYNPKQANLQLIFPNGRFILGGCNESTLTSFPAGLVILEEASENPLYIRAGSTPHDMAKDRTSAQKTFGKVIVTGQENLEYEEEVMRGAAMNPAAILDKLYLESDMRDYFCTCQNPDCAGKFAPKFEHLSYEKAAIDVTKRPDFEKLPASKRVPYNLTKIPEVIRLHCPHCDYGHKEGPEKFALLSSGEWISTIPEDQRDPKFWGVRLHCIISNIGPTWADVAIEMEKARASGDPKAVSEVKKKYLAIPESPVGLTERKRGAELVLRHCGKHEEGGPCPIVPTFATMTADVQGTATRFPWSIAAHDIEGNVYVMEHGQAASFDDLEARFERGLLLQDGATLPLALGLIDEGDGETTDSVRQFCIRSQRPDGSFRWWPSKGRGEEQLRQTHQLSRHNLAIPSYGTVQQHAIHFQSFYWTHQVIAYRLGQNPDEPRKPHSQPRIIFPRELSDAILSHYIADRLVQKTETKRGKQRSTQKKILVYEKGKRENDWMDCLVAHLIAAALIGHLTKNIAWPGSTAREYQMETK